MNMQSKKTDFGVTLTKRINPDVIGTIYIEEYVLVLDIRGANNVNTGVLEAQGIKERTLRKLQNYQISYEQMPIDFNVINARQENELLRVLCEQAGNVLVLSNQSAEMIKFCHDCHIPVTVKDLILVHNSEIKTSSQDAEPKKQMQFS